MEEAILRKIPLDEIDMWEVISISKVKKKMLLHATLCCCQQALKLTFGLNFEQSEHFKVRT